MAPAVACFAYTDEERSSSTVFTDIEVDGKTNHRLLGDISIADHGLGVGGETSSLVSPHAEMQRGRIRAAMISR